jgi:hypothetical protein
MCPNLGEPLTRSTGPNEAIPIAEMGSCRCFSRNQSITRAIKRPGLSPVANSCRFLGSRTSSGPRPRAHTNLVPPASIPPTTRSLRLLTIDRLFRVSSSGTPLCGLCLTQVIRTTGFRKDAGETQLHQAATRSPESVGATPQRARPCQSANL